MALDHFVSQVHLKNFNSPRLGGTKLHAIKKGDLKKFICSSKDICRIEEGSTNAYLENQRVIEAFLTYVEPNYNKAVAALREGRADTNTIFVIAGFAAYVMTCSPAAMRLNADPLRRIIEMQAEMMDTRGQLPKIPAGLGATNLSELLKRGAVRLTVDEKYPQALGISLILSLVDSFGNARWDILTNGEEDLPFFTSDYPVAVLPGGDPRVAARLVPLAPDIAVCITPSVEGIRAPGGMGFPHFAYRLVRLQRPEVLRINSLIVRCAENQIYYRDDSNVVERFVGKHAGYELRMVATKMPAAGGFLSAHSLRICPKD